MKNEVKDLKYSIQTVMDYELFKNNEEMCDWLEASGYDSVIVNALTGKTYYFPSPTLGGRGSFTYAGDKLTPFVKMAHEKGLSVIAEIQDLNPHFGRIILTRREIGAIVQEILNCGVYGIIEEDFDEIPGQMLTITQICSRNNVVHIHKTKAL